MIVGVAVAVALLAFPPTRPVRLVISAPFVQLASSIFRDAQSEVRCPSPSVGRRKNVQRSCPRWGGRAASPMGPRATLGHAGEHAPMPFVRTNVAGASPSDSVSVLRFRFLGWLGRCTRSQGGFRGNPAAKWRILPEDQQMWR